MFHPFPNTYQCGSITIVLGSFGLLESVYLTLGTNSEALILVGAKWH